MDDGKGPAGVAGCDVDLNQTGFFQQVIGTLANTLEEVVGLEDAASFVGVVGGEIGDELSRKYSMALGRRELDVGTIAAILVDLKARIGGSFRIESITEDEICLVNGHCPFARQVVGRPSLCMMTTNVFGRIVSRASGYAHVEILEAIATGHAGCRVRVHLRPQADVDGYEFFA
jgi:predicted ArsR family transcriptional regulator